MEIGINCAIARDQNHVVANVHLIFPQAIALADEAANTVTLHRFAEFFGYGDAEHVLIQLVFLVIKNQIAGRDGFSSTVEPLKIAVVFHRTCTMHFLTAKNI